MPELERLKDAGLIRLVDLLFVTKNADGELDVLQTSDLSTDEATEFGAIVGALVGLGSPATKEPKRERSPAPPRARTDTCWTSPRSGTWPTPSRPARARRLFSSSTAGPSLSGQGLAAGGVALVDDMDPSGRPRGDRPRRGSGRRDRPGVGAATRARAVPDGRPASGGPRPALRLRSSSVRDENRALAFPAQSRARALLRYDADQPAGVRGTAGLESRAARTSGRCASCSRGSSRGRRCSSPRDRPGRVGAGLRRSACGRGRDRDHERAAPADGRRAPAAVHGFARLPAGGRLDAFMLLAADRLTDGDLTIGSFWAALGVAIVASAVGVVIHVILGTNDDDTYTLRVIQRIARRSGGRTVTDAPGIVFLEIDGLALPVLRRAMRDGNVPNMARWLADDRTVSPNGRPTCRRRPARARRHPAGMNDDIPAFRWVEKEDGDADWCARRLPTTRRSASGVTSSAAACSPTAARVAGTSSRAKPST